MNDDTERASGSRVGTIKICLHRESSAGRSEAGEGWHPRPPFESQRGYVIVVELSFELIRHGDLVLGELDAVGVCARRCKMDHGGERSRTGTRTARTRGAAWFVSVSALTEKGVNS